jgi:hypothetical protein
VASHSPIVLKTSSGLRTLILAAAGIILVNEAAIAALRSSHSRTAHVSVHADEQGAADMLAMFAERVHADIVKNLGVEPPRSTIPIHFFLANENSGSTSFTDRPPGARNRVEITARHGRLLVEARVDRLPVAPLEVRRMIAKACLLRIAYQPDWEHNHLGIGEVPDWLLEGMALHALHGVPDITLSATELGILLAKRQPDLSFERLSFELEGGEPTETSLSRKALGWAMARLLLQDKERRDKLLRNLRRTSGTSLSEWMMEDLGIDSPEKWWRERWPQIGSVLISRKLSFASSRNLLLETQSNQFPNQMSLLMCLSPWLKHCLQAVNQPSVSLMDMVRDGEIRRDAALDWFSEVTESMAIRSRGDLLLWRSWPDRFLQGHDEPPLVGVRQGVGEWFAAVSERASRSP